jgi:hypothetical protein
VYVINKLHFLFFFLWLNKVLFIIRVSQLFVQQSAPLSWTVESTLCISFVATMTTIKIIFRNKDKNTIKLFKEHDNIFLYVVVKLGLSRYRKVIH